MVSNTQALNKNTQIDFSKPVVALAPLAGYTDLPFRSMAKQFGCELTFCEMISANALAYNNEKTNKMITKAPNEDKYFVQIAGYDEDIIKRAVEKINEVDGILGIDLNCGCPAPKVFHHGSGSSLLGKLDKLSKILEIIKKHSNKQYTSAKVRLGINEKIPKDIAQAVQSGGADFVSVHGRTKKGAYKAEVDYDAIALMKESIDIPLIANGDITNFTKAKQVIEHTKADGVMIGRGAIGAPWIFYQLHNMSDDVSPEVKAKIVLAHLDAMVEFYGEYGVVKFRKHLHTYAKKITGAKEFRSKVNQTSTYKQTRLLVKEFFDNAVCEA